MVQMRRVMRAIVWRWRGDLDRTARRIAAHCRAEAARTMWPGLGDMTLDQARGYAWARAVLPVQRQAAALVRSGQLPEECREEAAHQAVSLLVTQLARCRARGRPAGERRKAA